MRPLLTAAVTACLVLTAVPGMAIDLDSLLVESVGGKDAVDSIRHLTTYHASGTVNLNGLPGVFTEYFMAPNRFYLEMTFDAFSVAQAYDGTTVRQRDHTGNVVELSGYERREVLKSAYVESFAYLFPERMDGKVAYGGLQDGPDGDTYHLVRFVIGGHDTLQAFLDTANARRRYLKTRLDNEEVVTTLDEYRTESGILFPFYSRSEAPSVPLITEVQIEFVSTNIPVSRELFSLKLDRTSYRLPGGADSVVIPMVYHNGYVHVEVWINGAHRVVLILDSGSSATILHEEIAAKLDLSLTGSLPAKGISGYEEVRLFTIDSLAVGDLMLYDHMTGSLDLSGMSTMAGDSLPLGGVLGYDFLSRFPLMVDYQKQTLTVYNPDTFVPDTGGVALDFHLTMLAPTVRASIEGLDGHFLVDLGNGLGLLLHHAFVQEHGLDSELSQVKEVEGLLGGVGGTVGGRTALADSLRLDGVRIDSLRVFLPEHGAGLAGSKELAGNIGNRVLDHFRLLLDYSSSTMVLYPSTPGGH